MVQSSLAPFPWKLHDMLRDCEKEGKSHVVSWLPHGKAFRVHKVTDFVGKILPSHFKQTKYKSFQRQLNLWGFERITRNGPEKGAYFHKSFLLDQPRLCRFLTRQRGNKKSSQLDSKLNSNSGNFSFEASFTLKADNNKSCGFPSKLDELRFLDEEFKGVGFVESLATHPVSFEGCKFFPLDVDRCEELTLEVTKITSESASQRPQRDSAWDLLQELEQGSSGFPKSTYGHSLTSILQGAQLCAV
jgi:hypothetical protein